MCADIHVYTIVGTCETAYINNYIDRYNNRNTIILKQNLIIQLYDPINNRDYTKFLIYLILYCCGLVVKKNIYYMLYKLWRLV